MLNTAMSMIPFAFDDALVRAYVDKDGNPWFVGKDVAMALGYLDTHVALRNHCKGVVKMTTPSAGGPQIVSFQLAASFQKQMP